MLLAWARMLNQPLGMVGLLGLQPKLSLLVLNLLLPPLLGQGMELQVGPLGRLLCQKLLLLFVLRKCQSRRVV